MNRYFLTVALLLAGAVDLFAHRMAVACPFCSAVAQTFTEEMGSMDAVVIAKLTKRPPPPKDPPEEGERLGRATFEIVEVLKGGELVKVGQPLETLYFGEGKVGTNFIVMAVDPEKLLWSTPLPLSDRGREYFYKLKKLPKEGVERLVFFQDFLEDKEDMLARDAYDEFAKAPFDVVKELKPQMRKAVLWAWINDLEGVPASRRRLYLTMLSVCGDEKDLEPLETMLTAADKKQRSGLDALVACYLTLKGDAGLPFIETLFLSNKKADYAETYSTIMALRFHATESDVLSKPRIVQSLRFMLERPELADLVIPDLARLEDWDAAPRLMELYRTADEKSSWVRVPIINFLRAGPDKAKMEPLLKECEKIDPDSVKRANTLFPFGAATKTSQATPADEEEQKSAVRRVAATEPVDEPVATIATANTNKSNGKRETAANIGATRAVAALKEPRSAPAIAWMLGVPSMIGMVLALAQWQILRGAGR